ncbi:hypothetical protein SAMN04488107_1409 [Geodermatophilus saharensis]|uniref:Uncharacterized protein n=1 Tax=Geodermatophilus saharensis TaxID=1137994 RepID=A0A239BU01_9ACTN|nr:hypothetical protein [Geodermatophilus saharensis]SNS10911.1 hypothetical protein SAMN04488107_1409 [Geodermatophilus saharensis]
MTVSDAPTPGEHPRREMSEDEKLIAQWEARHDVAARGHRLDPQAVQDYLSHARATEHGRSAGSGHGATRAAGGSAGPVPPAEPAPAPRSWWRRLLGRS